jgi:hypothetical protein
MSSEENIPNGGWQDKAALARRKSQAEPDGQLDLLSEPLPNVEYIRAWESVSPGAALRVMEIVSEERKIQRRALRSAATLRIVKEVIQVLSLALACAVVVYAVERKSSSNIGIWLGLAGLIGGVATGRLFSKMVEWARNHLSNRQSDAAARREQSG